MEMKAFLTAAGAEVVNSLLADQGQLVITRAEIGTGCAQSETAARMRTELIQKAGDAQLAACTLSDGHAVIDVQYRNDGQQEDLAIGEIGIFCRHPADESREVLYCYAAFGDTPDTIVKGSTAIYARTYRIAVFVSDLKEVHVELSPAGAVSQEAFLAHGHGNLLHDGTVTAAATGDVLTPVFAGTDGALGLVPPEKARAALDVNRAFRVHEIALNTEWTQATAVTAPADSVCAFFQTVQLEGLTETSCVLAGLSAAATAQQREAAGAAQLFVCSVSAGSATVCVASGATAPAIPVPITLWVW